MTGAIMWALGLLIGAIFGAAWGYEAGRKSVVIVALPEECGPLSGVSRPTDPDSN